MKEETPKHPHSSSIWQRHNDELMLAVIAECFP